MATTISTEQATDMLRAEGYATADITAAMNSFIAADAPAEDESGEWAWTADGHGYCDHSSGIFNCDGGADEDEEWCTDCDREVTVTERQCAEGFTGAPVYFTTFSCGHQEVDASADTLDAVR